MSHPRNKIIAIAGALISFLGEMGSQSHAQSPEAGKAERMKITGSRLKRTDTATSHAIQVLSREELESSGFNSVADVLRETAASTHGATKERSGRGSPAASGTNIRGLGEEYTLVLLNGRRLAKDAVLEIVDTNVIPMVAVERVEVMKEGASAIYGSDAIGGVVNIITRKNLSSTSVLYSKGFTDEPGGEEERVEAITGFADSQGQMTFSLSYRTKELVMNQDRAFSADGWSDTGNPGSYRIISVEQQEGTWAKTGATGNWTADPTCPEDALHRVLDAGDGNTYCQFNYAKAMSSSPEIRQLSLMMDGERQVTNDTQLFYNVRHTRRSTFWNYAPAPDTFTIADPNVASTITQAGVPAGSGVEIRYRTVELGNRDNRIETQQTSGTAGLRGSFTPFWDWEISASKTRIHSLDQGISGYWLKSVMQDLVKAGQYNPLDPNRDTAIAQQAAYVTTTTTLSQLDQYEAFVTGELADLDGGPLALAIGTSWMEDYYLSDNDTKTINDEVAGSAATNGEGRRNIKSYYLELRAPFTQATEVSLAARHDRYSDVGEATSPQIGLKWRPTDSWLLRLNAGKGFRAPSLQALTQSGGYSYPSFVDAPYCAKQTEAGNQAAADVACARRQYLVRSIAGDLEPETSQFATIGTVVAPTAHFDLSFDLWYTKISNRIAVINNHNLQSLMEAESSGVDYAAEGIEVKRDANGKLEEVTLPSINMSSTEIQGFDLNINLRHHIMGLATGLSSELSYFISYKESLFDALELKDTIGDYGRPQWKLRTSLSVKPASNQEWVLTHRLIADQKKANPEKGDLPQYAEYDTQYVYSGHWGGTISVGAVNLFNNEPPLDETANPKVDSDLYNVNGRQYYFKVTQSF